MLIAGVIPCCAGDVLIRSYLLHSHLIMIVMIIMICFTVQTRPHILTFCFWMWPKSGTSLNISCSWIQSAEGNVELRVLGVFLEQLFRNPDGDLIRLPETTWGWNLERNQAQKGTRLIEMPCKFLTKSQILSLVCMLRAVGVMIQKNSCARNSSEQ